MGRYVGLDVMFRTVRRGRRIYDLHQPLARLVAEGKPVVVQIITIYLSRRFNAHLRLSINQRHHAA